MHALPLGKTRGRAQRIGIVVALLLLCVAGQAQYATRSRNAAGVDSEPFHFGFVIGVNVADVRAQFNDFPIAVPLDPSGRRLENIRIQSQPGLNLGLVLNASLGDRLDVRFVPQVSLQQRNFFFEFSDGSEQLRILESSYLQLPLLLKWKSAVYRDYRVFVSTGPMVSLNLASQEDVLNDPELLKIESSDLSWVFTFGFDLYGDKVKLTPELFYHVGLSNVYVPLNEDVPGAIESVFTQAFGFQITFGG